MKRKEEEEREEQYGRNPKVRQHWLIKNKEML